MSATPTPYNARETFGLLWRNLVGPSRANPAGVAFLPRRQVLAPVTVTRRIGFAGDIMMMFGKTLSFGPSLTEFFAGCDHLVANLEGVLTDLPKRGPDQKHSPQILDALAGLAAPEKFALSVANNHGGDFGEAACRASVATFRERGFRVFGLTESPFMDLDDEVRVVTGTQWSNRDGDFLAWLSAPENLRRADALNILFPHWGYEMQCFPRAEDHAQAHRWLHDFDAVIGHHSHTPQPVSLLDTPAGARPVAWSLGDFCFGLGYKGWPGLKHYPWGIVVKLGIGPLTPAVSSGPQRWAIGEIEWAFTDCAWQQEQRAFRTEIVERIPCFR